MSMKKVDAYEVTLYVERDYPKSFLEISRSKIAMKNQVLEVKCHINNYITVVILPEVGDRYKSWLSQFGPITDISNVLCVMYEEVDVDYDFYSYDDIKYFIEG